MRIGIGIGLPFRRMYKLFTPENIFLSVVSNSELDVHYDSLYSVEIWVSTDSINFTKVAVSYSNPYRITGLSTEYVYYIKIRVASGGNYSDYTNIVSSTTFPKSDTITLLADTTLITSDIN